MNDNLQKTIAAISTALSESGIGIIRVSGPDAVKICSEILFDKKKQPERYRRSYVTEIEKIKQVVFRQPQHYGDGFEYEKDYNRGQILFYSFHDPVTFRLDFFALGPGAKSGV